jgi:hypothetical protein
MRSGGVTGVDTRPVIDLGEVGQVTWGTCESLNSPNFLSSSDVDDRHPIPKLRKPIITLNLPTVLAVLAVRSLKFLMIHIHFYRSAIYTESIKILHWREGKLDGHLET